MDEIIEERIKFEPLREKVMTAEEAARFVTDGMRVGTAGTPSGVGVPVSFFEALVKRAEDGEQFRIDEVVFQPTPLQRPRIPIWVAAIWPNRPPLRRAARWDGLFPLTRRGPYL